jgi:hypothetical protein
MIPVSSDLDLPKVPYKVPMSQGSRASLSLSPTMLIAKTNNIMVICSPKTGPSNMPTLRYLLEELRKIKVDPDEVRIPGQLYDDLADDAEDIAEENPTEEDD